MKRTEPGMRIRRLTLVVAAGCVALAPFASSTAAASDPAPRFEDAVTLPAPPGSDLGAAEASAPASPAASGCPTRIPRADVDRPDLQRGPQVHVVYLVADDFGDERLDMNGTIECSVQAWGQWFVEQTDGIRWRIDTFRAKGRKGPELVDVTFVRSTVPGAQLNSTANVEAELVKAGLVDPQKLYIAYVAADGAGTCGRGRYPLASTGDDGAFGGHGRFAYAYLFGSDGCHGHEFGTPGNPRWLEATVMQEMLHSEGVVPLGAPHACTGIDPMPNHLCTPGLGLTELAAVGLDPERIDVMFPFVSVPLAEKVLDRDRDDYFGHSLPLRDLSESPYLIQR